MAKKAKNISHEEVSDAMARFLKKGGVIKKIMKRIGVADDHPYFDDNNLDVPTVRANVGKKLNSINTLAPKP